MFSEAVHFTYTMFTENYRYCASEKSGISNNVLHYKLAFIHSFIQSSSVMLLCSSGLQWFQSLSWPRRTLQSITHTHTFSPRGNFGCFSLISPFSKSESFSVLFGECVEIANTVNMSTLNLQGSNYFLLCHQVACPIKFQTDPSGTFLRTLINDYMETST